ncbi:glycosyltransferase [Desulfurivibrio alkaliphilus]|uniref:Glycosyl transferase group 1 n=1 Tax=Desulfurivibrio alkaliphilus (strain DSM 19089 / UNIQEM U267 / AHT2) TaxID=589865 RepID=D6YZS2_DESAT|nr:glycosyltransferase [Desulfurivibrio alkaliphilus]ADH85079.1 glycosyl transferase group 1 [Desulfurivibrio alkaliphilus AHT 2]
MKILLVIPYFMPAISYGGPVKVAYEIARGLVARGYEVTVATTDALDATSRVGRTTEVMEGISVLRFRNISNKLAKKCNGYLPVLLIPWLARNCRRFDVIYCHDFFSLPTVAAGWLSRYYQIPLLLQPHGSLSALRRSARFAAVKRLLIFFFLGILRGARNIIALTVEEKKGIETLDPSLAAKVVVIPNGLNPAEFADIPGTDLHRRYNIPQNHKIIGFIGRLAYIKGLDISLTVLETLKDRLAFSFLVIGPDEGEMSRLKQQVQTSGLEDRVIFAGILEGEEKMRVMKSCDFFLFTSRDEGLPLTILEVAALGRPQIASEECHVPELAEYQAGLLHPLNDLAGFARSIETLIDQEPERQVMGVNARKMVRERFSTGAMLDRIDQLLKIGPGSENKSAATTTGKEQVP